MLKFFFVKLTGFSTLCGGYQLSLTYCQVSFFCMTPLHAHAQYICIVYAKYQKASVKALVQVDFPVYALFKQKQNKQTGKKWLSSQSCHFVKN